MRRGYDGVGTAFLDDGGLGGLDLDHAKDANGDWKPVAREMIALDTYVEVSPSGTGLHVMLTGTLRRNDRTTMLATAWASSCSGPQGI